MNTPILIKKQTNIVQFIEFWSVFYLYNEDKESVYIDNINKRIFNGEILLSLYEWKNGSMLSQKKRKSFEKKLLAKIEIINALKGKFNLDKFKKEFNNVSLIWKIFLLHIINPVVYPIFDQHVFRAMKYIKFSKIEEIPFDEKEKEKFYFNEYINFFDKIKLGLPQDFNNKKIDEALWSFGKFLKSSYKKITI